MLLKITEEQTIKMIRSYYKVYEGIDVNVNIEAIKAYRGYYEEAYSHVNISVEMKKDLLGETIILESPLNDEEVKNIFKKILQEENYDITSFHYNAFIDNEEYLCHSCETAKFSGIEIEVKSNQNKKVKK